jgi:Cu(I)/Ag(I) efflux system membrane fusion protein
MKARNIIGMFLLFGAIMGSSILHAGTEEFDNAMNPILKEYLKIQEALAADKADGVKGAAEKILKLADSLDAKTVTGEHESHYKHVPMKIKEAANKLTNGGKDIGAIRETFKALSKPMAMWATMSKPKDIYVVYCSMAKGSWLQNDKTIRNPYYGHKMLRCGEIVGGAEHD